MRAWQMLLSCSLGALAACSASSASDDGGAAADAARPPAFDASPQPDLSAENAQCESDLAAQWATTPPATGVASAAQRDAYRKVFGPFIAGYHVPGAAFAVASNGRLVMAMGLGFADAEALEPVHPDNLFRIASVTKQITSAAVMKLVEANQINLDEYAFPIISDLQPLPGKTMNPMLSQITVRHLLNHTGGWNRDHEAVGDPMFDSPTIAAALGIPGPATCEDTIRFMLDKAPTYAAGSTNCYSNFGYCVLGRIIERRSHMSYEDFVKQNVLGPAGVTDMKLGHTLPELRADNEVKYYDAPGAGLANPVFPGITGMVPWPYGGWSIEAMDSHGGWIASPIDQVKFALGEDGLAAPPDLLGAQSLQSIFANPNVPSCNSDGSTTPPDPKYWYGFGWAVNSYGNHWHTGALDGTATEDVTASNHFTWAAFFNSRDHGEGQLFSDLDNGLWTALQGVTSWPQDDYFDQYTAFGDWLSASDYASALAAAQAAAHYPSRVEGRIAAGAAQYRAQFVPLHTGARFQTRVGMDCLSYRNENDGQAAQGLLLENLQTYVDDGGRKRYQATWIGL
jgi:N-acyl-D-amino-acid deacylase